MFLDVAEAQEGETEGTASGKKKKKKKKKPAGAKSVEGQGNSLKPSKQSVRVLREWNPLLSFSRKLFT